MIISELPEAQYCNAWCGYMMCRMTSANRQQLCLQYVYAADTAITFDQRSGVDDAWRCLDVEWRHTFHLGVRHLFFWHVPQWPRPVRKRFSNDHWRRGTLKTGSRSGGLEGRCITIMMCVRWCAYASVRACVGAHMQVCVRVATGEVERERAQTDAWKENWSFQEEETTA